MDMPADHRDDDGRALSRAVPPPLVLPNRATVDVDGVERHYAWFDADPGTTGPLPLVIAFHGGGGTMAIMASALGFAPPAAPRPYLTVFPQGYDPMLGTGAATDGAGGAADGVWNSGQAWVPYQDQQGDPQDDVAFFDALLVEMAAVAAARGRLVDQSRTYAIGFSNGGMMALRLAAERSRDLAAIAVMQATIGGDPDPSDPSLPVHLNHPADHGAEPVALLQLHGLLDEGVDLGQPAPPSGRNPRADLTVMDAVDTWVAHNGCDRAPTLRSHPMGLLRTWSGGANGTEVQLLHMPGVGHQVPEGALDVIEPFLLAHGG